MSRRKVPLNTMFFALLKRGLSDRATGSRGLSFSCRTLAILGLACLASATEAATVHQFTKVVGTDMPGVSQLGVFPALNNNNQISFVYRETNSFSEPGKIARWENGSWSQVVVGTIGTFISPVPMNDSGAIAYESGSTVRVVDATGSTQLFSSSFGADANAINNSGQVLATIENSAGNHSIFARRAGETQQLITSSGSGRPYDFFNPFGSPLPDINANGDVVIRGTLDATGRDGVYVHTSNGTITIDDTAGPLRTFGNVVDINDSGDVAYYGTPDAGASSERNLYLRFNGQNPTLIADGNQFETISEAGMVINNNGDVLFGATANGVAGLFMGGNPLTDRVVSVGDMLDGGRVTSLLVRRGMLNNSGNFVFRAGLDTNNDGNSDAIGIYFAEAVVAVPEPSTLAMCCIGLTAIARIRRRSAAASK